MAETKNISTPKEVEVTLIKACTHAGEDKKEGDKVKVTIGQKKVMQSHGLVKEDGE
tara:strand:+ start:3804 stop:3971 length:168 start_codon:yes stop_codon:yes gene_type:complete